jgi:hypothetical protein
MRQRTRAAREHGTMASRLIQIPAPVLPIRREYLYSPARRPCLNVGEDLLFPPVPRLAHR